MDILEKLDTLILYYGSTRGVGHTRTMMEGAVTRNCIIMAHSSRRASELVLRCGGGRGAISWAGLDLNSLMGQCAPLAIDNSAIYLLCLDAAREITESRGKTKESARRVETLEAQASKASHEIDRQRRQVETLQRLADLQETYIAKLEGDFKEMWGKEE